MEQIIEQLETPETVDFGGVAWEKRADRDETYHADLPGSEHVYVSQYESGGWNWQRKFRFDFAQPEFFNDRASGIVGTRDEAMQAALTADRSAYIDELVNTLAAAGFIGADSNYRRGFFDGQAVLKAAIAGLEIGK